MIKAHDNRCTGCSACFAVCPERAIGMGPDEEGFAFPVIDEGACTGCGLCESVCPIDNAFRHPYQDYCYVATSANDVELAYASSGGVFPILARYALAKGGLVCGCVLDSDCVARHVASDDPAIIKAMSKSKYVQSDMGDCLREVRSYLDCGRFVLFSGTPY